MLAHFQIMSQQLLTQEQLYLKLSGYLKEPYQKAKRNQIEKIFKNDIKVAIKNASKISEVSVSSQSTNVGEIIKTILK